MAVNVFHNVTLVDSAERSLELLLAPYLVSAPETSTRLSENDVRAISAGLCRMGKDSWAKVPRLYTVLRMVNQVQTIDSFLSQGVSDIWFPFSHQTLPQSLRSTSARFDFLQLQDLVLTKAFDLEREDGKHRHFGKPEDIPLQKLEELGKGGFGFVDRVLSTVTYKEYARKLIPRGKTFKKNSKVLKDFEQELSNLKKISHIHIVELVGSYTDPRFVGILMSPVADSNLKDFLARASLSPGEQSFLRTFYGCIASALCYLHEKRIRHKDIKPQNVLVKGHQVFLTDFGISLDWSELGQSTTTGVAVKTPRYCAPEVADYLPRNSLSDIWSLGCVFLEIWTVLKGESTDAIFNHLSCNGSKSTCYYLNCDSALEWCNILEGKQNNSEENLPVSWIREMLQPSQEQRWTAQTLVDHIAEANENPDLRYAFSGVCCIGGDDSTDSGLSSKRSSAILEETGASSIGVYDPRSSASGVNGEELHWKTLSSSTTVQPSKLPEDVENIPESQPRRREPLSADYTNEDEIIQTGTSIIDEGNKLRPVVSPPPADISIDRTQTLIKRKPILRPVSTVTIHEGVTERPNTVDNVVVVTSPANVKSVSLNSSAAFGENKDRHQFSIPSSGSPKPASLRYERASSSAELAPPLTANSTEDIVEADRSAISPSDSQPAFLQQYAQQEHPRLKPIDEQRFMHVSQSRRQRADDFQFSSTEPHVHQPSANSIDEGTVNIVLKPPVSHDVTHTLVDNNYLSLPPPDRRSEIITNIFDSQRIFCRDMQALYRIYESNTNGTITMKQKDDLFGRPRELFFFTIDRMELPPSLLHSTLGQQLAHFSETLWNLFQQYTFTLSMHTLRELSANRVTQQWLSQCHKLKEIPEPVPPIEALLKAPLFRILQYSSQLHALQQATPQNHIDYSKISDACSSMDTLSVACGQDLERYPQTIEDGLKRMGTAVEALDLTSQQVQGGETVSNVNERVPKMKSLPQAQISSPSEEKKTSYDQFIEHFATFDAQRIYDQYTSFNIRKKAVFVSDGCAGATAAMMRAASNKFFDLYIPTVFENFVLDLELGSLRIELALWDTSGQEDYDRLRPLSYPDAHVVVIGFSIGSPDSLDNVQEKWISEALHFGRNLPIVLVGYKSDVRTSASVIEELAKSSQKLVTYKQGLEVARIIGAAVYVECSSWNGKGIEDLYEVIIKCAILHDLGQNPNGQKVKKGSKRFWSSKPRRGESSLDFEIPGFDPNSTATASGMKKPLQSSWGL